MPFCVACGAEHPDTARFCPACGQPVASAPQPPRQVAATRKVVTVLFADIVGSTSLGERHDAETVQALLAEYFDRAAATIRRHGGTVEKFIGDAVVAVFGVPEAHEDDALRAVRAATELIAAVDGLTTPETGAGAGIQVRVGVNTGEVVVGDPSSRQTFSVGDAMNVAARLQQSAAVGEVLLGDVTYELVADAVEATRAGTMAVKGRDAGVEAWVLRRVIGDQPGRSRRLDAPLVGRRAELAVLQRAHELAAATGVCRLVTVLGDAGVGKSKLVHHFAGHVDATVLHGRCLSYGDGVTFWPIVGALRAALQLSADQDAGEGRDRILDLLEGDDAGARVADRLLEILAGGGTTNTQELFWAVRRFLEGMSARRPTVVVVDDIHWAEPTFLDLLEYLATWTQGRVLVACTARPELLDTRADWGTGANVETLALTPLSGEQAHDLVDVLMRGAGLPAAATRRVVDAAEGNPLYVEEMLRMLVDTAGADAAARAAVLDEWPVPPTVQALIAARLDRLDAAPRQLLQRAAVVGTEFSLAALDALGDGGAGDAATLRTLVHREFLAPQPHAGEEAYRFGHGLVRDVAYGAAPKRERARLHARLAGWMDARPGRGREYDEIIGHHLGQAASLRLDLGVDDAETRQLAARGSALLAAAGRRALARSDLPAAAKLLRRAASLTSDDPPAAAQLQIELCDALLEMGELGAVEELLDTVDEVVRRLGDARLAGRAAVMRAMLAFNVDETADGDDVVRTFDRVVMTLADARDFVGCSQAHQVMADVHWNASRFEAAQKDLESALEYADRAGDVRERGRVLAWLASVLLWGPTHVEDAIARCQRIVAESSGDLLAEGKTLMILAGLYAMQGHFDQARQTFARSRAMLEDLGMSLTLASGTQVSGMIELLAGDAVAAERELRRGYDALVAMGQKGYLAAAAAFLARALLDQGRIDEAESLAERLRSEADADDASARGDYASVAARLAAAHGRFDEAVTLASTAVEAYAETDELKSHADAMHDLAVVLAGAGRRDAAAAAAHEALGLYQRKGIAASSASVTTLLRSLGAATGQPSP